MIKKRIFLVSIFSALLFLPFLTMAESSFNYTPMERIPGFEEESVNGNFYSYIGIIYKFGLWTVGVCAMFMISFGGYMYIMSAGNSASATKAKGVIFDAIAGLILAMVSYLILYTINPNLVRLDGGAIGSRVAPAGAPTVPATPPTGNEAANRAALKAASIAINRPNACTPSQSSGCTTTAGLRGSTLTGLTNLKTACPDCKLTLTGGSESGHSSGTYSHANGYKADLALDPTLTSYIKSNYTPAGTRSDGATMYKDAANNIYALEDNHWDICYSCSK